MAKPTDHAAVLAAYLAGERVQIAPHLRSWPADLEPTLAVRAVMQLLESPSGWGFGRTCKHLPAAVIRGVLAEPSEHPHHLFLRLAVSDEHLLPTWERAVAAILDLHLSYEWRSKKRRARFRELAADATILAAIQGVVANTRDVSRDMLAVLVADGSAASYDALVPHLDAALHGKDRRLERLTALRIHAAKTPELDALFAEVDATLDERNAVSPALAVGPLLGIGHVEPLYFHAWIYANVRGQANVRVDSRRAQWLQVSATNGETHLYCEDLAAVPAWIAAREVEWNLRWERVSINQSNLRGAKREAVGRWALSLSQAGRIS